MIITGEKLNSSVPKTLDALTVHDVDYIKDTAALQESCGAEYIDINTALTGKKELENLLWCADIVMNSCKCGIMLDSPDEHILEQCLLVVKNRKILLNSVTADPRFDRLIAMAAECGAGIVGLPINGRAVPKTADGRVSNAGIIIEKLRTAGIPDGNIFIDALTEAVATDENAALTTLETTSGLRKKYPDIHIICGLSNISFGLPKRSVINSVFLPMLMAAGLDSAILDITSKPVSDSLFAANALLGKDEYCLDYISYIRNT